MWPLTDITVYYYGTKIQDSPKDWKFRKRVNFISDFYHNSLDGYKPPKTGRICIRIDDQLAKDKADYFGAICQVYTTMDEQVYLTLSKVDQYEYLLRLIHESVVNTADQFEWGKEVFMNAFNRVTSSNFNFIREYEMKNSRDRKNRGRAILTKTEDSAIVSIKIEGSVSKEISIIEKGNWYWFDSSYDLAKSCKWIDKTKFGFMNKKTGEYAFYSLESDLVESNMQFGDKTV